MKIHYYRLVLIRVHDGADGVQPVTNVFSHKYTVLWKADGLSVVDISSGGLPPDIVPICQCTYRSDDPGMDA